MTPADQIGTIVGAVCTLLILSYLLGDNFLYRLATHILVGAGAGYIFAVVIGSVFVSLVAQPILALQTAGSVSPEQRTVIVTNAIVAGIGLLLGILLLFKLRPRWAFVGNASVGYLIGVGAAVALGGALFGTLAPQIEATAKASATSATDSVLTVIALVGTLFTLASFGFYRAARGGILSGVNAIGRFFLSIALGATFALVYVASVSLLIDRTQAVVDALRLIVK